MVAGMLHTIILIHIITILASAVILMAVDTPSAITMVAIIADTTWQVATSVIIVTALVAMVAWVRAMAHAIMVAPTLAVAHAMVMVV